MFPKYFQACILPAEVAEVKRVNGPLIFVVKSDEHGSIVDYITHLHLHNGNAYRTFSGRRDIVYVTTIPQQAEFAFQYR